jgi:hypothetical protein
MAVTAACLSACNVRHAGTLGWRPDLAKGVGFNGPAGITSDATHVWVANRGGPSVTELNASTGAVVQVLTGSSYGCNYPAAIASDGTQVANEHQSSVTELPA